MKKLNIEFFHVYQRSDKFKRWSYTLQCHENYLLFIRAVFRYYRRQFYNPVQTIFDFSEQQYPPISLLLLSIPSLLLPLLLHAPHHPIHSGVTGSGSSPDTQDLPQEEFEYESLQAFCAAHLTNSQYCIGRETGTYVKNPCSCVVTYIKRKRSVVVIILPRPVTSRPHATRVREQ